MTDPGWSAPARRVDPDTARRGILWQHQRVRALLEKARAVAEARLETETSTSEAVASAIGDLRSTMEVHFTYEEAVLLPIWRADDAGDGPRRAHQLVDEHGRQRGMLAALHQESCAHPELPTLAAKLASLATWLLADMEEEERTLPGEGNS